MDFLNGVLYAVGYKGEIWFYNKNVWQQEVSPTKFALTRVICLSENDIIIVGLAETIIRGYHRSWQIINQSEIKADFWGLTIFQSQIYLSNGDGIFILEEYKLTPVSTGLPNTITTCFLHANDGVLCAVGSKDIIKTSDGVSWVIVEAP